MPHRSGRSWRLFDLHESIGNTHSGPAAGAWASAPTACHNVSATLNGYPPTRILTLRDVRPLTYRSDDLRHRTYMECHGCRQCQDMGATLHQCVEDARRWHVRSQVRSVPPSISKKSETMLFRFRAGRLARTLPPTFPRFFRCRKSRIEQRHDQLGRSRTIVLLSHGDLIHLP